MSADNDLVQPRRSFFALLWGMIRHPGLTLDYLRHSGGRAWILMALLAALSVVALVAAVAPITARLSQEALRAQMESQPGLFPEGEDPEMQARISQFTTNPLLTVVMPSATGVIGMALGWLMWAGGLHLLSVMVGGNSHFGAMWAGVIWSYLPIALRNGLQTIFVMASGEPISNQGLSGLLVEERSVAELIATPPSAGRLALQSLLAQIDLFTIWNIVLLFIAVMTIARLSRRKALGITLGVWFGLTAVRTLFAVVPAWLASGF